MNVITVPAYLAREDAPQLEVRFGGHSSAGHKPANEDAFAAHQPSPGVRASKGVVACIADGVSCSDDAAIASQTAVTTFVTDYFSTPDLWPVKTSGHKVLAALNAWLYHHGGQGGSLPALRLPPHRGLVTTFSAVVIKSTTAHLFHAGDSRIWLRRNGQLEPLTRDHLQLQRGGAPALTRALGMDNQLEMDYLQEPLRAGDLLLLTTDGVHAFLSTSELNRLLEGAAEPERCARAIVDAALARGSDDNLSALLVEVMALPVAAIDELHRELTQRAIPPVLAEGQLIEGYRVERIVHSGTRSHIYRVRCEADQRVLLLKAPSAALADDAAYLESFIREQWAGRRIDHSGVMKMFAPPERSAFLYHLCEYIEGQTLRQWILDHPHPPLETVRALTQEIVAALRAFQRQHMVHRDLKPENIMVTSEGRIKLIDFGTVQVGGLLDAAAGLAEEIPVGTADYSAPEYLAGEPATHRSDIFSLGAIVYEMLTGAQPYAISDRERQQPARRHWRYRSACAVRCDLPLWIDVALEKSVHPDPRQRYPALSEFMHDLSTPNRDLLGRRERRPLIERNPLRFWQALVLFLLLVETLTLMLLLPR